MPKYGKRRPRRTVCCYDKLMMMMDDPPPHFFSSAERHFRLVAAVNHKRPSSLFLASRFHSFSLNTRCSSSSSSSSSSSCCSLSLSIDSYIFVQDDHLIVAYRATTAQRCVVLSAFKGISNTSCLPRRSHICNHPCYLVIADKNSLVVFHVYSHRSVPAYAIVVFHRVIRKRAYPA